MLSITAPGYCRDSDKKNQEGNNDRSQNDHHFELDISVNRSSLSLNSENDTVSPNCFLQGNKRSLTYLPLDFFIPKRRFISNTQQYQQLSMSFVDFLPKSTTATFPFSEQKIGNLKVLLQTLQKWSPIFSLKDSILYMCIRLIFSLRQLCSVWRNVMRNVSYVSFLSGLVSIGEKRLVPVYLISKDLMPTLHRERCTDIYLSLLLILSLPLPHIDQWLTSNLQNNNKIVIFVNNFSRDTIVPRVIE